MPVEFKVYGPPAAVVVEYPVITPEEIAREEARERRRQERPMQWYRFTWRDGRVTYREYPRDGEEVSHYIARSSDPDYYVAKVEACDGPPLERKGRLAGAASR